MQLFFSTISELKESFLSTRPTGSQMEEYVSFVENKLQATKDASLGFFKSDNRHEAIQEKLVKIFLENKKEISADELKILTEHFEKQQKNQEIQRKALYQLIISVVVLGISIPLISSPEFKEFGFSTIGMVIGYWLK